MFKKVKKLGFLKQSKNNSIMENIVKSSRLLTNDLNFDHLVAIVVEQSLDVTRSNISAFYKYSDNKEDDFKLELIYKRGYASAVSSINRDSALIEFIEESKESVIVLKRNNVFRGIFLNNEMNSAIALPIYTPTKRIGVLVLNSIDINFYNKNRFHFLDTFSKMASGILYNSLLYQEMKASYKKIESLERYQEGIFESMTNLLVALDSKGNLNYANSKALKRFCLNDSDFHKSFFDLFASNLSTSLLTSISTACNSSIEVLGIEGIYTSVLNSDMDFKLNISPLLGTRGKNIGTILIFTDETREQELKKQMSVVTEERRQIKDMFGRYLSKDLVNSLINKPELVKPGGDQKLATVLFADIRGYTSFSEGKDPAYIIEILNEYFNEAVEKVISSKGYIDKFIGDCIMAAWGVPMMSESEDAINAVTCALEIQKLIKSKKRHFFTGNAENLKVGIGMHSGFLVAGNLGSSRRMDYTIIGDTVNVAARLEGVAEAGEIIITQDTKDRLNDSFLLEERTPVKVKGKSEPIHIYNVIEKIK